MGACKWFLSYIPHFHWYPVKNNHNSVFLECRAFLVFCHWFITTTIYWALILCQALCITSLTLSTLWKRCYYYITPISADKETEAQRGVMIAQAQIAHKRQRPNWDPGLADSESLLPAPALDYWYEVWTHGLWSSMAKFSVEKLEYCRNCFHCTMYMRIRQICHCCHRKYYVILL